MVRTQQQRAAQQHSHNAQQQLEVSHNGCAAIHKTDARDKIDATQHDCCLSHLIHDSLFFVLNNFLVCVILTQRYNQFHYLQNILRIFYTIIQKINSPRSQMAHFAPKERGNRGKIIF
jgi:hypothetical protein